MGQNRREQLNLEPVMKKLDKSRLSYYGYTRRMKQNKLVRRVTEAKRSKPKKCKAIRK